jgi:hypothetical protein
MLYWGFSFKKALFLVLFSRGSKPGLYSSYRGGEEEGAKT